MRWTIKSGNLESEQEADNAFDACIKAVKSEGNCSLGMVITATPFGSEEFDDDMMICSTDRVLEAAGIQFQMSDEGKSLLGKDRH